MKVKIIGCGLSGITAAVLLKERGHDVEIFETRKHLGGNCFDGLLGNTLIHNYGPHIFHTNDEEVFKFLSRYTEWFDFENRPLGNTDLGLISLPYSKKTISQIGRELSQEEIVKYFFKDYSEKQWGVPFDQIPVSITNRIPKTKDCENPTWYEGEKYQCLPKEGYTKMMENMLSNIKVHLACEENIWRKYSTDLTVYTGKIDAYYDYIYGKLPYRSLEFKHYMTENKMAHNIENQNKKEILYTRKYDHSFFSQKHSGQTVITEEFSIKHTDNNIPYYPIPFNGNDKLFVLYKNLADLEPNTIFLGRLASYKYLDMWMAVKLAMLKIEKMYKL